MGAGHGQRLPRRHAGLPRRRGHPPRRPGKTVGTWFAENIAGPLGADFHIGTPAECDDRVAKVIPPPPLAEQATAMRLDPDSIAIRALTNPLLDAPKLVGRPVAPRRDPGRRRSRQRALGRDRPVDRVRTAGRRTGKRCSVRSGRRAHLRGAVHGDRPRARRPAASRHRLRTAEPEIPFPSQRSCFWGGWGGSLVINDLDNNMTVAYVMNRMGEGTVGDMRAFVDHRRRVRIARGVARRSSVGDGPFAWVSTGALAAWRSNVLDPHRDRRSGTRRRQRRRRDCVRQGSTVRSTSWGPSPGSRSDVRRCRRPTCATRRICPAGS